MTTFVDGQTLIEAAWLNQVDALLTPAAIQASAVVNTPAGGISAVTVQAAIDELDTEKSSTSHNHTGTYEPVITNLPVSQGGVGITSYTAGDILYATGATTLSKLAKGTANQELRMNAGATAPEWYTPASTGITSGTPWVYSTPISTLNFDSIPSTVKQITISISALSTNGTAIPMLRLKDAGGEETTGYNGAVTGLGGGAGTIAHTTGFLFTNSNAAADVIHGNIILTNLSGNIWTVQGSLALSNAAITSNIAGSKELSATLTGVSLFTADSFDAGTVNVIYQ